MVVMVLGVQWQQLLWPGALAGLYHCLLLLLLPLPLVQQLLQQQWLILQA
jgi:hypothetical protein